MLIFRYFYTQRKDIMKTLVGIEYLAAVALIKIYEDNRKKHNAEPAKVSFESLNNYGIKVMEKFVSDKINAVILMTSAYAAQAVRDYGDCFSYEEENGEKYLVLKSSITDLKIKILAYLSVDILKALIDENVLKALEK